MTSKTIKTILFASLIATLAIPMSSMDVAFADEFKTKKEFKDKKAVQDYGKELEKEMKKQYKQALKSGDRSSLDELKAHGLALIHEYDPTANPLPLIEDEYFALTETNDPSVAPVRYETIPESQISNVVHIQGNVDAKIGYDAPCILIPIFVCSYQETSTKNVPTTSSGKSFGIWTDHNTSWLAPYTKLYTVSGGNYDGYTVYGVTNGYSQELGPWNFNGPQIFGHKDVGPIAGSSCSCTSIASGNYISALVVLDSVH